MLSNFRPYIKGLIDPIARRIKIHPNYITVTGFFIALLSAYMFAQKNLLMGGVLLTLSGFADVIDGEIARSNLKSTKFGGFLDSTIDRFSEGFIIIGITFGGFIDWLTGMLVLLVSLSVSYVRARAEVEGIPCDIGLAERAERLIILILGAFLGLIFGSWVMEIAVIIILILGFFTLAQRIYHSWKMMSQGE